jgi:hypothetical protein
MASLASRQYDWQYWKIQQAILEIWIVDAQSQPQLKKVINVKILSVQLPQTENQPLTAHLSLKKSPSLFVEKLLYTSVLKTRAYFFKVPTECVLWDEPTSPMMWKKFVKQQTAFKKLSLKIHVIKLKEKNSRGEFKSLNWVEKIDLLKNSKRFYSGSPEKIRFCF